MQRIINMTYFQHYQLEKIELEKRSSLLRRDVSDKEETSYDDDAEMIDHKQGQML